MQLTVDRTTLEIVLEALETSQPYPTTGADKIQAAWRRHQGARAALYALLEHTAEPRPQRCPWDGWRPTKDLA